MSFIFGRKEKKKEELVKKTNLEELCAGDKEVYDALFSVMFLDPRKIQVSMKQAVENAKRNEKEKYLVTARMWYEVAGGLAIYEGDVKKVIEYFEAAKRISGEDYPILKNAEKAVTKAQDYYKRYLQT